MDNGLYALVCAVELSGIQLIAMENAIGIPFGILCNDGETYGKTIFSTVRKFEEEISYVAAMWGIDLIQFNGNNKERIRELFEREYLERMILGPLDVTALCDFARRQQDERRCGYLLCIRDEEKNWQIRNWKKGEEQIMSPDQIMDMVSIQGVKEAKGQFTARAILDVDVLKCYGNQKSRYQYTLEKADRSLKEAWEAGQGPKAFERCVRMLERQPQERWMEKLRDDMTELIRYKNMLFQLLHELEQCRVARVCPQLREEIRNFICTADQLRGELDEKSVEHWKAHMKKLEDSERRITENWNLWVNLSKRMK